MIWATIVHLVGRDLKWYFTKWRTVISRKSCQVDVDNDKDASNGDMLSYFVQVLRLSGQKVRGESSWLSDWTEPKKWRRRKLQARERGGWNHGDFQLRSSSSWIRRIQFHHSCTLTCTLRVNLWSHEGRSLQHCHHERYQVCSTELSAQASHPWLDSTGHELWNWRPYKWQATFEDHEEGGWDLTFEGEDGDSYYRNWWFFQKPSDFLNAQKKRKISKYFHRSLLLCIHNPIIHIHIVIFGSTSNTVDSNDRNNNNGTIHLTCHLATLWVKKSPPV